MLGHGTAPGGERALRPSGYASRLYELGYASSGPLYDLIVWWGLLPLGGSRRSRRLFAEWCDPRPGQRIACLCCGTGSTEQALFERAADLDVVGIDLGPGQLANARRRNRNRRVDYRLGNAAATGLAAERFDRVVIVLALHEMPRSLRLRVLAEARRICRADGRVVAIEHNRPATFLSRTAQWLCWFFWLPGNPEAETSRDLQRCGLATEMREARLEPCARHVTRPDWIEAVVARPA